MLKKTTSLLVAAAAFFATTGTAVADTGRTTGGGLVTSLEAPFAPFHFTVNASAAGGRVTLNSRDVDFVGSVDCYVQVGNTVVVAGPVVKSHDLVVGNGYFVLAIEDNGAGADLVSFNAVEGVPLDCTSALPPTLPLASGNVQVHGA